MFFITSILFILKDDHHQYNFFLMFKKIQNKVLKTQYFQFKK